MAIEAMPPAFLRAAARAEVERKGAPERRVIGLKRGANGEKLRIMMFFEGPAFGRVVSPRVSEIIHIHDNRIIARSRLP